MILSLAEAKRRNRKALRRALAAAWRHRPRPKPSQWIARNARLDKQVEAGAGRYDLDSRPWWKFVLDLLANPEVDSIAIPAGTQIGKTLGLIMAILWCAENDPSPLMLVAPDKDTAIELRDRVYAAARATIRAGKCSRLRVPPERKWNTRYIDLGACRLYLAWAGSRQRLRGRPCRRVFLTEIDVYQGSKKAGNPIAAAHQRTKAFFRGLKYHESSPTEYPSEICQLESSASARFRWYVPCPHCGLRQELRFFTFHKEEKKGKGGIAGYRDEAGELLSIEQARRQAYYVCEAGCRIDNEDKQIMLERGVMAPLGAQFDEQGNLISEWPASMRSVGVHLWSVHSETITFGDIAAAYVEAAKAGKLPEFFGNWLGLEYKATKKVRAAHQVGRDLAGYHPRRTVPAEAWFLSAGADVQGENNGVRYTIRAWAPGCTSWLVDWGWLDRNGQDEHELVKSDLRQLRERVLELDFPVVNAAGENVANPLGYKRLKVKLLCIDSNHLPFKVHHWLRSLPEAWVYGESPRVRAIRGDHQLSPEVRWRHNLIETNARTGEVYEGGLNQWGIYVYPFYDELLEKITGQAGKLGSWHVTSDTLTQGMNYLEQITNFGPSVKVDPKSGLRRPVWGPRNHKIPVDFWDCEIYGLVAANMIVGDLGWDVEKWEAWREARKRPAIEERRPRSRSRHTLADRDAGDLSDR